jgi:hypothetical protein
MTTGSSVAPRRRGTLAAVAAGILALTVGGCAATGTPAGSPSPASDPTRTLEVSGTAVGGVRLGADLERARAAVAERLGEPDLTVPPQRYTRLPETGRWAQDAADPMSPSWRWPVTAVSCWDGFCLVFGGTDADTLRLRGWELAEHRRWGPGSDGPDAAVRPAPDVRLAGSGIRLGDPWATLHAAYPGTSSDGGEGAALVVDDTPWPGIFDGVGAWRLSGVWDYEHPRRVPAGAVVTRLSGGEGPELGCC